MATVSTRTEPSAGAHKYVAIRPAFRPLLPKPAAPSDGSREPTVLLKSQKCRIMKKRKAETSHSNSSAAVVAAVNRSSTLPATISPASLISKRPSKSSRKGDEQSRSCSPASSGDFDGSATSPAFVEDLTTLSASTTFSPSYSTESSTPLNLFNHIEDLDTASTVSDALQDFGEEIWKADSAAGLDGVAGLNFDDLAKDTYLAPEVDTMPASMDIFAPCMDMFS